MGQTVNLLVYTFGGSNPSSPTTICGSSSVDRASAFQAEGREFEPRLPLKTKVSCDAQTYGEKGLGGNAKLLIFKEKGFCITRVFAV